MVRRKDPEKRQAILQACAELISKRGLDSVPTAEIARIAGVAEGTVFSYFPNKSDLYNTLYLDLRVKMFDFLGQNYQKGQSLERRFVVLLDDYLDWGINHPTDNVASNRLADSKLITQETVTLVNEKFPDLEVGQLFQNQVLLAGHSDFAESIFTALADLAIIYAQHDPENNQYYRKAITTLISHFLNIENNENN
ncbi:TetR/AcrR family transcriptional regulator [Lapidilactobacillus wuchangensis]|uniref:TetR/AcrR family transcriptional regulator n=1 Tax=Lapidilactobacillus wuchangensis TaxID=2486001 RepID=UPI0013DE3FA3|nr:TetR/AcrR family transcriptional regulator [Lapidilactobacillus wuchangensis]